MFVKIKDFFFGKNPGLLFCLIFIISIITALVLECYEKEIWGKIYNAAFCMVLFILILALTNRPVFSVATTSFIFSSIWIASEIKFGYVNTKLILLDLHAVFLSKEVLAEMALKESMLFLAALASLACLFCKETTNKQIKKYPLIATALAPLTVLIAAYDKSSALTIQPHSNSVQIFIESYNTSFNDFTGNDKFCCMKANRTAERFSVNPEDLPHIVIVLEESTFMSESIVGYKNNNRFFDGSRRLGVHTVGGGTWVQEIALLHGVPPPKYGKAFYSINLYAPRNLDGRLLFQLSSVGYDVGCIFPLNRDFAGETSLHEAFGTKNFIECSQIEGCTGGWNSKDSTFLNEALMTLKSSETPQFVFLHTIKQHSPHNKYLEFDKSKCAANLNQKQCSVLMDYSSKEKESVQSLDAFLLELKRLKRRVVVVVFGDHIPGDVSALFDETHFQNGNRFETFFTIWDSKYDFVTDKALAGMDIELLDIAFLDVVLLKYLGFESPYISAKIKLLNDCKGSFCDEFNKND